MKLKVNGEEHLTEKNSITQLLAEMGIVSDRVAVEVNLQVIKRAEYDNFSLKDDDSVEIVHFVGGGESVNVNTQRPLKRGHGKRMPWPQRGSCG